MLTRNYIPDRSHWWYKPAAPWQFWRPQSGIIGGILLALLLFAAGWPVALLVNYLLP